MRSVRGALRLLSLCRGPLFLFEAVYKLAGAALFVPGFSLCFSALMRLTGHKYLTAENLLSFALHPLTLIAALALFLLIAFYFLIDIGVTLCMLSQAAQERRCGVLFALTSALRAMRRKKISPLLLIHLPCLGLFLHLGVVSALFFTVRIPVPISSFLLSRPAYLLIMAVILLLLCRWMLRWLFMPAFCLVGGESFREARQKSVGMSKRRWPRCLSGILLVQLGLILFYGLAALAGIPLLRLISASLARSFLTAHVMTFLVSALLAVSILSIPCTYALVWTLMLQYLAENGESAPRAAIAQRPLTPRATRLRAAIGALCFLCAAGACALIVSRYQRRLYNLDIEYLRSMEITAHRGDSAHSPENTMAAFQTAWDNGADWIELDVRQSSDGMIYCMHDSTFTRVTGVKKQSWELSWNEISQLDAGSHFSAEFAGEKLPLLAEAIDFARQCGVRLNIELKPTAHDDHLEQAVAQLILENDFAEQCVVTCQRYDALKRIKEYAPELTTVYVMSMAYGNLEQLTDADHFSISYHFINRDMVSRLHRMGKQVYAWTVDRQDIMERMIDLGVDNIITNNVALGKACVTAASASDIVQTLVEELVLEDGQ
ncbi:MAG: glycerophosphoryl diester phosphodiesterase membrane domain-containing protein [Clostridia bacterium]|nr:glycerophosphoryl diester phosphodiesterase membrane domain-containing protein [Clostridia bacterium]